MQLALGGDMTDFDYDEFQAPNVEPNQLASALQMPPMFCPHRVVWVRDAERLKPKARAILVSLAETIAPDTVLIVTATTPPRSKAKFYQDLRRLGRVVKWTAPRNRDEIPAWIRKRAKRRWNFELDHTSALSMADAVGADLSRLDAELEKISLLEPEKRTPEMIAALVPRTNLTSRWDWLDTVASREYVKALRTVDEVLTADSGVSLVTGLVEHHILLGLAIETRGSKPFGKVLVEIGRGYLRWKAQKYLNQSRKWTRKEVDQAFHLLKRADRHLKSGIKDGPALSDLLVSLQDLQVTAR